MKMNGVQPFQFLCTYNYCTKYASAAPALVKYVEHVRKMARRGQDWKYYDKHFGQTEYLPCDYINWEAMNEAQYRTQPFRGHFYEQNNSSNTNNVKECPTAIVEDFTQPLGESNSHVNSPTHVTCAQASIQHGYVLNQAVQIPQGNKLYHPQPPVSPVKPLVLERMLQGYDKNKVQFLKNGFIEGFKLGFNGVLMKNVHTI